MKKSNTKVKTNHQQINILTSLIIMDGISTIRALKSNQLEKMLTTILDFYSTHVIHPPNKINLKINNNNNLKKERITSMMITAKFLSMSIKMVQLNGCVLNSLSLSKTVKLQELDLLRIIKMKKPTDSKKETRVQHIQDHSSLVWSRYYLINWVSLLRVLVLIMLCYKMYLISVQLMNINFILNGLRILNQFYD